ncbi:hypothetical protein BT69DRAFT_1200059, partial [Atractiella rhizophila]
MKLIITGATGLTGSEVLRQALLSSLVTQVTVLSRRPIDGLRAVDVSSPKLNVILHSDFLTYPPSLNPALQDHDACIWALGPSSNGISNEEYVKATHDYAVEAARYLSSLAENRAQKFNFVFVSAQGAKPDENTRIKYEKIKGRTEKSLHAISSTGLSIFPFRPPTIFPYLP